MQTKTTWPAGTSLAVLTGTSLAVHWLKLCLSTARGMGLTPSLGTKIPHAAQFGKKKKNYYYLTLYRKGVLTSFMDHDLSSGYMQVYIQKVSSSYILSMTILNPKEGKERQKVRRRETENTEIHPRASHL